MGADVGKYNFSLLALKSTKSFSFIRPTLRPSQRCKHSIAYVRIPPIWLKHICKRAIYNRLLQVRASCAAEKIIVRLTKNKTHIIIAVSTRRIDFIVC